MGHVVALRRRSCRCCSRRRGAAASGSVARSRRLRARGARACRARGRGSAPASRARRNCRAPRPWRPRCRRRGSRRWRARCAPCCRSAASARRSCCWRSCRRRSRGRRWRRRRGRTGLSDLSALLSCSSTRPGCTRARRRSPCPRETTLVHVLGAIEHQGAAHGLAALRGAAAARQHRDAGLARDLQRRRHVLLVARHHHADGLDLVDRGIGAVAAAARGVEQHLAPERALETRPKRLVTGLTAARAILSSCRNCDSRPN